MINKTIIQSLQKLSDKRDLTIIDIVYALNDNDIRDNIDDYNLEDQIDMWDDFIEDYISVIANINSLKIPSGI